MPIDEALFCDEALSPRKRKRADDDEAAVVAAHRRAHAARVAEVALQACDALAELEAREDALHADLDDVDDDRNYLFAERDDRALMLDAQRAMLEIRGRALEHTGAASPAY